MRGSPGGTQWGQPGCAPGPRGGAAGPAGGDVRPKEHRGTGAARRAPPGDEPPGHPCSHRAPGEHSLATCLLAPRVSSCNKALLRFGLGRSRSGVLGGGELGFTSTPAPPLRPHKRRGAGCSPAVPSRSSMFICISHGGESPPGRGDAAGLQDVPLATATVPADNQSFLVNTDCPVLLLLSHLRSKVGVPATGELGGQREGPRGGSPWGWHHWDARPGFSRRHRPVRQAGHPQAALPGQDPTGEGQRVPPGARHLLRLQGGPGHPR